MILKTIKPILDELHYLKKRAFIVGGYVRDMIMELESKDLDVEVYDTSIEELKEILEKYARVDAAGKSFGSLKISIDDYQYDFTIPRKESKIGIGHKGFEIDFEKDMTLADAAKRRDFTINSIAYDPFNETFIDYYEGISDIKSKTLRHISEQFGEDGLRVLRGMQFQCRFNFDIDINTLSIMKKVYKEEYKNLPISRISEEWMKWAEKGQAWWRIFDFLRQIEAEEPYTPLLKLKETPQDPEWHPEGDVEIHTKFVLVAMKDILEREKIYGEDRIVLVFSALLHDISKPDTTRREMKKGKYRIVSPGHEAEGAIKAEKFLIDIGIKSSLRNKIIPLIDNHITHLNLDSIKEEKSKLRFVRRLARKLYPATIKELILLIEADCSGRPPLDPELPKSAKTLEYLYSNLNTLEKASIEAGVINNPVNPIIKGRHLISVFGLTPGSHFKDILQKTLDAQEAGEFETEEKGLEYIKNNLLTELTSVQ